MAIIWYKTDEAAAYLGLSVAALRNWRIRGGGPVYKKLGRIVRYTQDDLDAWLAERTRRHTSDPGPTGTSTPAPREY